MTSVATPFMRIDFDTIDGSAPNRSSHTECARIVTAGPPATSSSGVNPRPTAGGTPRVCNIPAE